MFSLGNGTKFWLYTKPTDMMKLLRYEPGGLVIDAQSNTRPAREPSQCQPGVLL